MFGSVSKMFFMCLVLSLCGAITKKTKSKMTKINDCQQTDVKYDEDFKVDHFYELYQEHGVNYIRANFTVPRRTLPVHFLFRGYRLNSSGRKLDFRIGDVSCKHPIIGPVLKKFKLKFNLKDCTGYPGAYTLEKFNLEDIAKVYNFYNLFALGSYQIEMEYVTPKGTIMCYAVTLVLWQ